MEYERFVVKEGSYKGRRMMNENHQREWTDERMKE